VPPSGLLPFSLLLLRLFTLPLPLIQPPACHADDLMAHWFTADPPMLKEYQDVEVVGNRAFIFAVGGMAIFDLNEQNLVGVFIQDDPPMRLFRGAVGPQHVYAGAREDRLLVIDVAEPSLPQLETIHGAMGLSYEGMAIRDGYLYAARHGDGLEVLDLGDPAAPVTVAELTSLFHSWDVAFRDEFALVADGGGGLAVVEASDPTAPVHVVSIPTSGAAVDICVTGDLAVVALGSAGVDVFDVDDPENPVWMGNYNSSGLAMSVAAVGDTLYLADWDDIEVIDLSFPESPGRVGFEIAPIRAMGLAARGNEVTLADWGRVRGYLFGPTSAGDIHLPFRELAFAGVPPGETEQLTFACINTGGGSLAVSNVQTFSETIVVEPPVNFVVPPGQSHELTLTFSPQLPGFDATFVRIDADDPDEPARFFPVIAGDDPNSLELGDPAPDFTYHDLNGTLHSLSDYLGKVVVLAFFANW